MPTGKVKWFDERRGFGYILADEGGPDVFVHRSVPGAQPASLLPEGQPVAYEVEIGPKGPRALSVRPVQL
jgi:cold shock CspA family protein